jgi:hypothetical protein
VIALSCLLAYGERKDTEADRGGPGALCRQILLAACRENGAWPMQLERQMQQHPPRAINIILVLESNQCVNV